uniref:Uncharacterized protein n=1 Tax=Arundo donax TaxID=35708 RepID=A0A0A9FZL6_ARUDO
MPQITENKLPAFSSRTHNFC